MLNPQAKLSPEIFSEKIFQKPTRDGYGDGLVRAGEENQDVVVLCADLTESTRSLAFREKFPGRFVEVGVAEQNMAAVAAGLGVSGKCVFISSYACFSPGRNWEQIRTTIAYNDSNVKIAGAHAGLMTGPDGATHQMLEDMAIMRAMPNMKVLAPCDATEAKKVTLAASRMYGPFYFRFGREKSPLFTTEETPFEVGKAQYFWLADSHVPQATIIACGTLVYNALLAAKELSQEGIHVDMINSPSIKPLDEKTIVESAKKSGAVVTVEEHQINGGLGGAVAECLSRNNSVPMEFVGVQDRFGESGGAWELVEKYGMGVNSIKEAVKQVIARKSNSKK